MSKIAYIVSLSHSGSTLLDLLLGTNNQCVGLGEIEKVLLSTGSDSSKYVKNRCSCGMTVQNCEFWGQIIGELSNFKGGLIDKYSFVVEHFQKIFGEDTILVDSSKKFKTAVELNNHRWCSIKAIFIIKDVRNYTNSAIRSYHKTHKKGRFLNGSAMYHYLNWYKQNRNIINHLTKKSIDFIIIGYEDLCFNKHKAVNDICRFLGINFEKEMLNINNSKSHIIVGNRMRNQKEKQEILYDYSWFNNSKISLPSVLFPYVMKFNNEITYNSAYTEKWYR